MSMKKEDFDQFVSMMEQNMRLKDSIYKGFINTNKSMLSCTYLKQKKLQKGRYMSTRIHVSEWIKEYMFEVRVIIRADGDRHKGVVPLDQNTLECHCIRHDVFAFMEVEQEAISMAQKLGWL